MLKILHFFDVNHLKSDNFENNSFFANVFIYCLKEQLISQIKIENNCKI